MAFSANITSVNPYLNGILKVAGYYIPNDLVSATDEVPVDNPDWLVYAVAAELARNDAAKDDQFSNLMGMANELYIEIAKKIANSITVEQRTVICNLNPKQIGLLADLKAAFKDGNNPNEEANYH